MKYKLNVLLSKLVPIAIGILYFLVYRFAMLVLLSILLFLGDLFEPVAKLYSVVFGFTVLGISLIDFIYPLISCRIVIKLDRFTARKSTAYTEDISRKARVATTAFIIVYHVFAAAYAIAQNGFQYTYLTEQIPYILFALGISAS